MYRKWPRQRCNKFPHVPFSIHSHQGRNCSITSINSVGLHSFQTSIFQLFTYIFPKNKPLQRPPLFSCLFPIIPFGLHVSADFAFFFPEKNFLESSRFFQMIPNQHYFVLSASIIFWVIITRQWQNGLILAPVDCSRKRSSAIKACFSKCVQQFVLRDFREDLKEEQSY